MKKVNVLRFRKRREKRQAQIARFLKGKVVPERKDKTE